MIKKTLKKLTPLGLFVAGIVLTDTVLIVAIAWKAWRP